MANFGFNPYGKELNGKIMLKNSLEDTQNHGCKGVQPSKQNWHSFILLDRSKDKQNCSVAHQAKMANEAGYSMVIVIDYEYQDLEYINIEDEYHLTNLSIPVIILKPNDGFILKNFIQSKGETEVKVYFNPPNKLEVPQIEFFLDTMDWNSYVFLMNFKDLNEQIKDKQITFTPKFPTFSCYSCEKNGYLLPSPDCLGNGRYCSVDPDGQLNSNNQSGKDATKEKIRSICVYQNFDLQKWLKYQTCFAASCMNLSSTFLDNCSRDCQNKHEIANAKVEACYKNSFYYESGSTNQYQGFNEEEMRNRLLEQEMKDYNNANIPNWPALRVNGKVFKGDINERWTTFEFICQGFVDEPKTCREWNNWNLGDKMPTPWSYKQHFWTHLFEYLSGFGIIFGFVFTIIYCHKKQVNQDLSKQLSLQVNSQISQYYALNSSGNASMTARIKQDEEIQNI
ncbi:hypothetical protein PPERSA_05788 [Pseudocohnilembus persalinus]|uniref:Vacuolar sorting receptor thioredoxin-like domain-containing protein n=1 Tax=Pseudocohnilembus persalinus TaxID=266149 RepID=A0A0V0R051_PSEPJ|nr:hypothetical protein PPERSA_05788 [Pseudocohnilembus persalinus]|eukprot:KRX07725.1 hypothetical protein PPERSA_05788 [Pseudocohnilembus persalinus]